MSRRIMAPALIAALLLQLAAAPPARALYRIYDNYAVEVVLDKPGVTYNLAAIVELRNATPASMAGVEAFFYKAPLDTRIGVFIYIIGEHLAIRVQAPLLYRFAVKAGKEIDVDSVAAELSRAGFHTMVINDTLNAYRLEPASTYNVSCSGVFINISIEAYAEPRREVLGNLSAALTRGTGEEIDIEHYLASTQPRPLIGNRLAALLPAVLLYELLVLTGSGTLQGLGRSDIASIAASAEPGAAGPANQIRYIREKNTWGKLSETGGLVYIASGAMETGNNSSGAGSPGSGGGENTGESSPGQGAVGDTATCYLVSGLAAASATYLALRLIRRRRIGGRGRR